MFAALLQSVPSLFAADQPEQIPDFERDVRPVLMSHCVRCHGAERQEARLRLDTLSTDLINDRAAAEYWHEVLNVLNTGEMPPKDEPQLTSGQRTVLTHWVGTSIKNAIEAQRRTGGRVVLRRLNRVEYQNTMFDLLGLEMNYARDLPPDPVSPDGFRNDGQALQISPMQVEYYLDTARRALDRVIVTGPAPKVYDYEFTESNVKQWMSTPERSNRLGRQQAFLGTMINEYPEEGEFLVRVRLNADLVADVASPILEVSVGYRPDTQILFRTVDTVEVTTTDEQVFEFRGRLEDYPLPVRGQGKYPGLVVRVKNVFDDGSERPKANNEKGKPLSYPDEPSIPKLNIQLVEFHAPVFDQWPPKLHRQILFDSPLRESNERVYVTEVLARFMERAFRRPVADSEVARMVDFYLSIRDEFPTFEDAIRETLAMVLISPDFLYLVEPDSGDKRAISDWEFATRLSYFLWKTMPDERLREFAATGRLREPAIVAEEVERLLNDPRSSRFVELFTEQWLHLDVLDRVAVNRDYYSGFDESLKVQMRAESVEFVSELIRHNLSALNLLASDFTMLNEPLAKHYGIPGVLGQKFRRVALAPELHRGGLLGHAGVLLANSTGEDSHAVRRAVWIRDRLLNDPPAPPPPNVPNLDEADPEFVKLSIRDQLKVHREAEACASCHRNIDPWGIALEHFDAVGLWRDNVRRKSGGKFETLPVNATDHFPDGREIAGVDSLKELLIVERKDQFARGLVVRLLTYALGRRLELSDQSAIDDLTSEFAEGDYQLRRLIHQIVASQLFQTK